MSEDVWQSPPDQKLLDGDAHGSRFFFSNKKQTFQRPHCHAQLNDRERMQRQSVISVRSVPHCSSRYFSNAV